MHSKNCKKYQNKEENKMAKKKEQKDMAQEQEQRLNFQQKLIEIIELGKKKKNMLEYQEIADAVSDVEKKFKGEGRVLIRPSGTEPLVRVMIEGKDKARIDKEAHRIADLIQQLML